MIGTLTKIVSGAQTGADRGALDAALAAGLQIGGWAPSGWIYDAPGKPTIAVEYRKYMRLTSSQTTGMVARLNVQDSDATLLLSFAHELSGHGEFVLRQVKAQRKPCKHLVLPRGRGVVPAEVTSAVWEWLQEKRVSVLNVAGPRESKEPGIQAAVKRVIAGLLRAKQDADTAAALALQDAEADAVMATETAQAAEERAESLRRMIDMGLPVADEIRAHAADRVSAFRAYAAREQPHRCKGFPAPTHQESLPVEGDPDCDGDEAEGGTDA